MLGRWAMVAGARQQPFGVRVEQHDVLGVEIQPDPLLQHRPARYLSASTLTRPGFRLDLGHPVRAEVLDVLDAPAQAALVGTAQAHVLGPHAQHDPERTAPSHGRHGNAALCQPHAGVAARHWRFGLQQVHGRPADEARNEQAGWEAVDPLRIVGLQDLAFVHHHDVVGQRHRLVLVVRDEHGGGLAAGHGACAAPRTSVPGTPRPACPAARPSERPWACARSRGPARHAAGRRRTAR